MSKKIFIPCDSAAVSAGADEVARAILHEAEERGVDIEMIRTGSRGMYWLEPLVEVETGNGRIGYGPVDARDAALLFEAGFLEGHPHEKHLGPVMDLDWMKRQNRVIFARAGLIDPLDIDQFVAHGGFEGLAAALDVGPEAVCRAVLDSGLRGRGGAGFSAGIKWQTVRAQKSKQKYVCCNADEGDSGTFADRMVMEGDPFMLLEGMIIAAIATGATRGFVYIRSEYPAATKTMTRAIEILRETGWLGDDVAGSGHEFDIEVRRGAGSYVCGEESAMLESLEGKRGQVRPKPPIPAISGLFGRPTLVNNVLTLASVPEILRNGADAYKALGAGKSTGTQAFQLGGNIRRGGLIEVEFGVTLRTLIEDFGGGTLSGRPFKCAQVGGPLGAYLGKDKLDVAMDYESLAEAGAMLGHGGIVVFDDSVNMGEMARFAFEFCALESCGKCTPCRIGSVRGAELMQKILSNKASVKSREEDLKLIEGLCEVMEETSLCALGGLTPLAVRSALEMSRLAGEQKDAAS